MHKNNNLVEIKYFIFCPVLYPLTSEMKKIVVER